MARQENPIITDPPAATASAKSLFDRVAGYLDANDWNYSAFEEKGYFTTRCGIKDGNARVFIDIFESAEWQRVLVYTTYPVLIPAPRRQEVGEAIARINYSLIYGNLDMDFNDGEVRVRTIVEAETAIPDPMIERALASNLGTAGKFFAPILAVAFGNAAPTTILDLIPQENATLQ
jgi:hypothetical protein